MHKLHRLKAWDQVFLFLFTFKKEEVLIWIDDCSFKCFFCNAFYLQEMLHKPLLSVGPEQVKKENKIQGKIDPPLLC